MRHFVRGAASLAGSVALLVAFAGSALAGGWAQATLIDPPDDPPTSGEEREIRFSLLQHGVTPVTFGQVQLTATHPETGEEIVVQASSQGGGEWTARVTFPAAGDWQIRITHQDLEITGPSTLTVGESTSLAWLPAALALGAFAAVVGVVLAGMFLVAGRSRAAPETTGRPVRARG